MTPNTNDQSGMSMELRCAPAYLRSLEPLASNLPSVLKTCKINAIERICSAQWMSIVTDTNFHCCLLALALAVFCPRWRKMNNSEMSEMRHGTSDDCAAYPAVDQRTQNF
jgi:hypothetical protein